MVDEVLLDAELVHRERFENLAVQPELVEGVSDIAVVGVRSDDVKQATNPQDSCALMRKATLAYL